MKTMFADFNAMTESEHVRLTTRGSQDDMERLGIKPGEWVWLSDGEMQVGARRRCRSTLRFDRHS